MEVDNLFRDIKIVFRSEIQRVLRKGVSSSEELDTAKLLCNLYNKNEKSKKDFSSLIKKVLYGEVPIISCDYLAFDFFMRIGDLENAFSILIKDADKPNIIIYQMDSLRILKILARMDFLLNNNNYKENQLKKILDKILYSRVNLTPKIRARGFGLESNDAEHRVEKMFDRIINLIDELRLGFLKERVGGEIYREDIAIIEQEIGGFGLSEDLHKSFSVIKDYHPKNEQEYAQNTGYLRSFLESIIRELSVKISTKKEEQIEKIPKMSEFVSNKSYLKKNDILDESEARLLGATYNILSSDSGSHILSTPQEKYRLLFNMTIEVIVLILSNFKKKVPEIKSEADKSRELLGGTTGWGGPMLYGDTNQKLKQLEGYGGKFIEEIREKLKKELKETE